jgi:transposase
VQAAWAAYRAQGTHLSRKFRRIAASRGQKRAAVAVAHTILVIIDHLLKERMDYLEIVEENEAA